MSLPALPVDESPDALTSRGFVVLPRCMYCPSMVVEGKWEAQASARRKAKRLRQVERLEGSESLMEGASGGEVGVRVAALAWEMEEAHAAAAAASVISARSPTQLTSAPMRWRVRPAVTSVVILSRRSLSRAQTAMCETPEEITALARNSD